MAKQKDELKSGIQGMIDSGKEEKQSSTDSGYRTISVGLTSDELAEVERIADELVQALHEELKYAVLDFVKRYNAGEKPETETQTVTVLKP